MGSMTIRDIPEEVIRRLDERAAATGRSREAEVRVILSASVTPAQDWAAFRHANALLRARFGPRAAGNSVDDLDEARSQRLGNQDTPP